MPTLLNFLSLLCARHHADCLLVCSADTSLRSTFVLHAHRVVAPACSRWDLPARAPRWHRPGMLRAKHTHTRYLLRLQVQKTGDVIEFYNAVFIPAVKAFVLALGAGKARLVQLPALAAPPGTPLRLGGRSASLLRPRCCTRAPSPRRRPVTGGRAPASCRAKKKPAPG